MQKLEQKEKRERKHDKRRRKEGAEQGEGSVPSVGPAKTVGRVVKACRRTRLLQLVGEIKADVYDLYVCILRLYVCMPGLKYMYRCLHVSISCAHVCLFDHMYVYMQTSITRIFGFGQKEMFVPRYLYFQLLTISPSPG